MVVDNLKIADVETILEPNHSGEILVMMAEFKTSINAYLKELIDSPVSSLADIIAFNENNPELVFHMTLCCYIITYALFQMSFLTFVPLQCSFHAFVRRVKH